MEKIIIAREHPLVHQRHRHQKGDELRYVKKDLQKTYKRLTKDLKK